MPTYKIIPDDILFFRDGRPMDAGGYGANWPAPSVFFDALHAAFHRAFPEPAGDWEHSHRTAKSGKIAGEDRNQRFGSLQTLGPYPILTRDGRGEWHFPCPQDVVMGEGDVLKVLSPLGQDTGTFSKVANTSFDLMPLNNGNPPTKKQPPVWWTKAAMEAYLGGRCPTSEKAGVYGKKLFATESFTGIGIDPATGTQDGEHIYSAEYLRLAPGVTLGLLAAMPLKNGENGMVKLIAKDNAIVVGGQQRTCQVSTLHETAADVLPKGPDISGDKVKWVLVSPAYFPAIGDHPGGWLPTWVDARTGQVLLKKGDTDRKPGESRWDWRKRVAALESMDCRLVSARIPKPIALSGWSERLHQFRNGMTEDGKLAHGAIPTILLVPAGSVYYFEGKDAPALAAALNWHGKEGKIVRRSMMGEKGFGVGVCAPY